MLAVSPRNLFLKLDLMVGRGRTLPHQKLSVVYNFYRGASGEILILMGGAEE